MIRDRKQKARSERTARHVRTSIVAAVFVAAVGCATTKEYTPTTFTPPVREGLKLPQPINMAVFDGRSARNEDLATTLEAGITHAYGTNVRVVPYYAPLEPDSVTVKIRVNQLHSEFGSRVIVVPVLQRRWSTAAAAGTDGWNSVAAAASSYSETLGTGFIAEGWWVGTSQLDVEVSDLSRGRHVVFSVPLVAEKRESNTWGYRTASSVSKKAWNATEVQMMRLIDDVVQKVMNDSQGP
jgi:hypothetical protein